MAFVNKGIPNIWFSGDKHLFHEFMVRGKQKCPECGKPLRKQDIHADGETLCCAAVPLQIESPPRLFSDVWEMNRTIISNHNEVVEKGDLVYELGDFALKCNSQQAREARYEMKGNFYFIRGNHDQIAEDIPDCWVWMKDRYRFKPKGWGDIPYIVLDHYAMRTWPGKHQGTFQLYGHSHGKLLEDVSLSFDIGVDTNNFYPYSLEDVLKRMEDKMPAWLEYKESLKGTGRVE